MPEAIKAFFSGLLGILPSALPWVLGILAIVLLLFLALVIFLVSVRSGRTGKRVQGPGTTRPTQRVSVPAPKASVGNKSGWLFKSVIVLLLVIAAVYLWQHLEWFDLPSNAPHQSSVSALNGILAERSATPEAIVEKKVEAPANGSYDPGDDAKTLAGNWGPTFTLLSTQSGERKISFSEDHSIPDPSPADVPWLMKCYNRETGEAFIWNGSNAVPISQCQFSSKGEKPEKVRFWLVPN